MRRILIAALAFGLIAAPAFAGNVPEFDAVGDDSANFFNDFVKELVVDNNVIPGTLIKINESSDWELPVPGVLMDIEDPETWPAGEPLVAQEAFASDGVPGNDICFSSAATPYQSNLTVAGNSERRYQYLIVLQMAPETDLDLNIRDCVFKHNVFDIWTAADQTGRYRADNAILQWVPGTNPSISAWAVPGPYHGPGFVEPYFLQFRSQPTLAGPACLDDELYTSKGLWEEGIVLAMPENMQISECSEVQYPLVAGDMVFVEIRVPWNTPVDLAYGRDNVNIKYVGVIGSARLSP